MSKTIIKATIIFGLITLFLVIIVIPSRGVSVSGFKIKDEYFDSSDALKVEKRIKEYSDNNIILTDEEKIYIILQEACYGLVYNITKVSDSGKEYYICSKKETADVYEIKGKRLIEMQDYKEYYPIAKNYYVDRNPKGYTSISFGEFLTKESSLKFLKSKYYNFEGALEKLLEEIFDIYDITIFSNRVVLTLDKPSDNCYPSTSECYQLSTKTFGIKITKSIIEYGVIDYSCMSLIKRYECSDIKPSQIEYNNVTKNSEYTRDIEIIYAIAEKYILTPNEISLDDFNNFNIIKNKYGKDSILEIFTWRLDNAKAIFDYVVRYILK